MNSILVSDNFFIIFVLVDDWYQTYAKDFNVQQAIAHNPDEFQLLDYNWGCEKD